MPERPHPSTHLQLLIPFVAFLAILPLLIKGPTCGHDFDFHLLSWLEAATQLAHGQYPHWAYTPAFNAGEPRFLFYPPSPGLSEPSSPSSSPSNTPEPPSPSSP